MIVLFQGCPFLGLSCFMVVLLQGCAVLWLSCVIFVLLLICFKAHVRSYTVLKKLPEDPVEPPEAVQQQTVQLRDGLSPGVHQYQYQRNLINVIIDI